MTSALRKTRSLDSDDPDVDQPLPKKHKTAKAAMLVNLLCYNDLSRFVLAPFLSAGDIFTLHRTSRECRSACEKWRHTGILRGRVIAALAARGHGPAFLHALQQKGSDGGGGAVVSGSLILGAIQGDRWQADDIDIYRSAPQKGTERSHRFHPIEDYLWSRIGYQNSHYSYDNYADLGFFVVRTYHIPPAASSDESVKDNVVDGGEAGVTQVKRGPVEHRCQVMAIRNYITGRDDLSTSQLAIELWIHDKYDLSFLANTFDGRRLVVHDTSAVSSRSAPYKPNTVCTSSPCGFQALPCHFDRIAKYAKRGYRVTNVRTEEENIVYGDRVVPRKVVYLGEKVWTTLGVGENEEEEEDAFEFFDVA